MDHLGDTADHHVPDLRALVVLHNVLEGSKEILLEVEVVQLALLDELHGQLLQGVDGEERDVLGLVASRHIEVVAQDLD